MMPTTLPSTTEALKHPTFENSSPLRLHQILVFFIGQLQVELLGQSYNCSQSQTTYVMYCKSRRFCHSNFLTSQPDFYFHLCMQPEVERYILLLNSLSRLTYFCFSAEVAKIGKLLIIIILYHILKPVMFGSQ